MDDNNFDLKKYIPHIIIVCLVVLTISVLFSIRGDSQGGSEAPEQLLGNNEAEILPESDDGSYYLAVVKSINTDLKTVTLMDTSTGADQTLFYSGGTDVRDKYDKMIVISGLQIGEIVEVYTSAEEGKLDKLKISAEAWEYKGVSNLHINREDKFLQISKSKFRYTTNLFIVDRGEPAALIDINERDELTIKGVNQTACSVIVTKGHGYVRFINYSDFIGGMVEVGYDVIVPVTENMLVVAREGSYKMVIERGNVKVTKNINVIRNRETIINLIEYQKPPEQKGTIDFFIEPYGAVLTIDGKEMDYNFPIELLYGDHELKVELGGYSSYSGILTVDEPNKSITIDLAEPETSTELDETEEDDIETDDGTDENNQEDDTDGTSNNNESSNENNNSNNTDNNSENSNTDSNTTGTTKTDENHNIIVAAPAGTEVYFDGVLKGNVPLTMKKEIGTHIISFRKDGYETKSYTVDVIDDNEDVTFSFPDLVKLQ